MIITFLISLGVFLVTLCPTVYSGDSGELTTTCSVLGVAHPPGYPLYVILGKIFTVIIPFGNIAYRVNLMSAFFGALTCGMVYLIVRSPKSEVRSQGLRHWTLDIGHWTAFVPALCLAFSNSLWSQSTMAEVYSLNGFFVTLIIYLLFRFAHPRINSGATNFATCYLLLAAFLFGLGFGNHHTLVLLLPGIICFVAINVRQKMGNRKSLLSTLLPATCYLLPAVLLGFSVYLFLMLRSMQNPIADWDNPENITNFLKVVFRTGYGGIMHLEEKGGLLTRPLNLLFSQLFEYVKNIVSAFTVFGSLLGIFGSVFQYKKEKKYFWFLFIIFIITGPFFIFLANKPVNNNTRDMLEPFYIPSVIIFAIWIGYAVKIISKKTSLFYIPVFGIILFQFVLNLPKNNLRYNFVAFDTGKNILKTVPDNSLLFLDKADESVFVLAYQKIVEKRRPSIEIYDCNASVFPNIYGDRYYWIKGRQRTAIRIPIERKIILESKKNIYYLAENPDYFTDMKFYKTGLLYLLNKKLLSTLFEDIYVLRQKNIRYRDKIIAYSFYVSVGDYYVKSEQPVFANAAYEKANRISDELK